MSTQRELLLMLLLFVVFVHSTVNNARMFVGMSYVWGTDTPTHLVMFSSLRLFWWLPIKSTFHKHFEIFLFLLLFFFMVLSGLNDRSFWFSICAFYSICFSNWAKECVSFEVRFYTPACIDYKGEKWRMIATLVLNFPAHTHLLVCFGFDSCHSCYPRLV